LANNFELGKGGSSDDVVIEDDEVVVGVTLRSGLLVDSLQFNIKNEKGKLRPSNKFGQDGGGEQSVNVPSGMGFSHKFISQLNLGCRISGIYGRSGKYLDCIGFYYTENKK
jgi:hypothetical protein